MRHPEFRILDLPSSLGAEYMKLTGLSAGRPEYVSGEGIPEQIADSLSGTIRLWPHKLEGEGHYLAVFRKEGSALRRRAAGGKPVKDREAIKLFKEFCEETLSQRGISKLETGGKDVWQRTVQNSRMRRAGRTESPAAGASSGYSQKEPVRAVPRPGSGTGSRGREVLRRALRRLRRCSR